MNAAAPTSTERRPRAARKQSMTSHHTLRLIVLAGLGPLLAAPVLAQEGGYFYGGLSAGQSRAKIDEERIRAGLAGTGLTTSNFARDERGNAFRLFGGYQINRYFGVEAGYFDLGRFGFTATTVPAGTLNGGIKLRGLNLDLVGTLPLTERLSFIARVGAQAAQARDNFSGTGNVAVLNPNPSKREVNAKVGAGLQYEVSRSFILRAEAERFRINDAVGNHGGINVVSVSMIFPFGRAEAPAPRMAAAPAAYVAPPPPPEPAPAPRPAPVIVKPPEPIVVAPTPPPPPPRSRVSFTAESLFGFDNSAVKPEGKLALDRFAQETRGTSFDVISVEGHTDRLGTDAYNQRLSTQRAEAVKAYLVSAGGLEASKINAVGKGETTPETKAGDCKGNKATPKLIACLQPDRRVEIEVTGTR